MNETARCVVVGGGPAGVVLTYLLARGGAEVTLLESRGDFDRRFRGDIIAPSILDHLDVLGLAAPMLATVAHAVADAFVWRTPDRAYTLADYRDASRTHPYYALVPQAEFLPFMVAQAQRFPGADVRMGARVSALLRDESGRVAGVEYRHDGRRHELRADLVVGADGRSSKVRALSSVRATELGASLDICWFAVPRRAGDPPMSGLELRCEPGQNLAVLGQGTDWQIGFTIPAGTFPEVRAGGVEPLAAVLRRLVPWLGDRIDVLTDVNDLSLLPVRITSLDRWTEPGLLLIGDAAHVISPVGGNGINLAILDAAEAANRLVGPLTAARPDHAMLDAAAGQVERVRRPSVDREQRFQVQVERSAAERLRSGDPRPPLALRVLSCVPGFARFSGRRSARALAVPPPVPQILNGAAAS
ncbi:FAD-dependent monooxygenase [Pseudonocardia xinjiangensis]|uniref:FAD-dependent monooxygenase n=1 Tax=Pseudonocardia xinjiangensis TaxID=75289 RepID=UPI003D9119CC